MSLDTIEIKQLLQDAEAYEEDRESISFIQLCNNDIESYGKPGSDKRRKFQQKWAYLKSRSIESYIKILHQNDVTPSFVTLRHQRPGKIR